jgi:pimeloyl-ACP methyl ester carboxylesterase
MTSKTRRQRSRFFWATAFAIMLIPSLLEAQNPDTVVYNMANTPAFTTNLFRVPVVDTNGVVYVGTPRQGLYRFREGVWTKMSFLTDNQINQIRVDQFNGVWVAQSGQGGLAAVTGGINYFSDSIGSNYTFYGNQTGLPTNNARGVFVNNAAFAINNRPQVWTGHISTSVGKSAVGIGINEATPYFNKHFAGGNGGSFDCVDGDQNEVWAIENQNGVLCRIHRYNPKLPFETTYLGYFDYTNVGLPNFTSTSYARALLFASDGRKWIALTNGGGLIVKSESGWKSVDKVSYFLPNVLINNNAIFEDSRGKIYVGTSNGLMVYEGGDVNVTANWKNYTTANGLPGDFVNGIAEDKKTGTLIIATSGGIAFWKQPIKVIDPYPSIVKTDGSLDASLKGLDFRKIAKGVATDGVAKVLMLIPSKEKITVNIKSTKDGHLSSFANPNTANKLEIEIEPKNDTIVAIFTAPDGFGANPELEPYRNINITTKVGGKTDSISIKLVTPPIVLVHGMWSNPAVWKGKDAFEPKLIQKMGLNLSNAIFFADYERNNASTFNPALPVANLPGVIAVKKAIQDGLTAFRNLGIAASQADVVGHSLGGLMTRSFSQHTDEYFTPENFKKGYVHKLITLGTPHQGSPFGPEVWNAGQKEVKYPAGYENGNIIWKVKKYMDFTKGTSRQIGLCHRDFGKESPGVLALEQSAAFKAFAIIGNYLNADGSAPDYGSQKLKAGIFFGLAHSQRQIMSSRCTPKDEFDEDDIKNEHILPNDLIVPWKSQTGYLESKFQKPFWGTGHSGPASVTETNNPELIDFVADLLLSNDYTLFAKGFPKPSPDLVSCEVPNWRQKPNAPKPGIALKRQAPPPPSEAFLAITLPVSGTAYNQKSGVQITLQMENGSLGLIDSVSFSVEGIEDFLLSSVSGSSVSFTLPSNAPLGKRNLTLLAKDTLGNLYADTASIYITADGVLDNLTVDPPIMRLDSSIREGGLSVYGHFTQAGESYTYSLSDTSTGTTYAIQGGNGIIEIVGNNLIRAMAAGSDTILITNNGKMVKVPVVVSDNYATATMLANEIDFPPIADQTTEVAYIIPEATAQSGDPVDLEVVSGPASGENGIITLSGSGLVTIRAISRANAYYGAAVPVIRSFTVTAKAIYTFTGNGNWDVAANWSNGAIPPVTLSAGEIIINPNSDGTCILNTTQTITGTAKLTVSQGKKFVINNNLDIKN